MILATKISKLTTYVGHVENTHLPPAKQCNPIKNYGGKTVGLPFSSL